MIFLYIGLPLLVAALLPLVGKVSKRVLPDLLANGVFLVLLVLAVTSGRRLIGRGPRPPAVPLAGRGRPASRVALDGFSLFMLMAIALVTLCVGLYSINYMEHYGAKANYYALLLMMMAGMNGLVLVDRPLPGLSLPRSRGDRFLRPGRLRPGARRARSLVQVPHALGRRLGGDPDLDRRPLRDDGRASASPRWPRGCAASTPRPSRRHLRGPVHPGLRAQSGPGPLPRLASRRPPVGARRRSRPSCRACSSKSRASTP